MRRQRTKYRIAAIVTILLLLPLALPADTIDFSLAASTQVGSAGDILTFEGTLSNPTSSTIFLNGDNFTTVAPFLTVDDSAFLANTPPSLAPNGNPGSSSGPVALFSVDIGLSALPGTYAFNSFVILGGADGNASDILASQPFTIVIPAPAVPEPSSLFLLVTGLAAVFLMVVRRRLIHD